MDRSTASTLCAAVTGSPSPAQIDSAAALSDRVIAAFIAALIAAGFFSRAPAMTNGTLIVDQAGPLRHLPRVIGACLLPIALITTPTEACSVDSSRTKSAASAAGPRPSAGGIVARRLQ